MKWTINSKKSWSQMGLTWEHTGAYRSSSSSFSSLQLKASVKKSRTSNTWEGFPQSHIS